jgi:hypothetical protein
LETRNNEWNKSSILLLSIEREVAQSGKDRRRRNIGRDWEDGVLKADGLAGGDLDMKSKTRIRAAIKRSEIETSEPESGRVRNDLTGWNK